MTREQQMRVVRDDARKLRQDIRGSRLRLAGIPLWVRPICRYLLNVPDRIAAWVERNAK